MESLEKNEDFNPYEIPPICKENEIKSLMLLKEQCEKSLGKYPDTMEEDATFLKSEELTQNQRNCIILRMNEKRIFQFYIEMAKYALEKLKGKEGSSTKIDLSKCEVYLKTINHFCSK